MEDRQSPEERFKAFLRALIKVPKAEIKALEERRLRRTSPKKKSA